MVSVSEYPNCIVLWLEESANNIHSSLKNNPNIALEVFVTPWNYRRHQHDFVVQTKNGKHKNIRVPILEVDNLGDNMAIDEKQIGGDFYTILGGALQSMLSIKCFQN